MRFFTSDTHFGHARIIELCNRPFSSVEEMNEVMIDKWNSVVKPDDVVIHLGDVALGKIAESLPLVGRLNGFKVLVPGNHDRVFSGEKEKQRTRFLPEYQKVFQKVSSEKVWIKFKNDKRWAIASHFPYSGDSHGVDRHADKRPLDNGLPLIHGHVHDAWLTNGRQFNVGVDRNDFAPVPESRLLDWVHSL